MALKLESTLIHTYAAQNSLLPQTELAAAAAPIPTTAPPALTPAPTVAPTAESKLTTEITPTAESAAIALSLPTPTAASAAAAAAAPVVKASSAVNVRSGPGLDYPIVDLLQAESASAIVAKSVAGDWWEIELPGGDSGWVYAQLVTTDGDVQAVAVAANIPTPPPTATPAPTSEPAAAVVAASAAAQPTGGAGYHGSAGCSRNH